MNNLDAITNFNTAFHYGPTCFYIIVASHNVQKQVAYPFITEHVAVYDYSGKEDTFSSKDIVDFIEKYKEKEIFFFLNFQIPFLGKEPAPEQPDYFALNLNRDVFSAYHKKLFFFMSKEIEHNISLAAMDFFDYCFPKIVFEDESKDEITQQIKMLDKDYDGITHKAEIEYRLNLYKDKIAEYLNIDISKYATIFIENAKVLTPEEEKTKNYLLVAARDLEYFAGLYDKKCSFDQSLELYNKALAIRKKIQGLKHFHTGKLYNDIGYVYCSQGNYPKALEYYQRALKICKNDLSTEATIYNNIGTVYRKQNNYSHALEYYQKALKILKKAQGNEHPDLAGLYNNIGNVYGDQKAHSQSLEYHQKALKILKKVYGNEHTTVALSYYNIGAVYYKQGDYFRALEYCQKALKIQKKLLGDNHPDTLDTVKWIEEINNEKLSK